MAQEIGKLQSRRRDCLEMLGKYFLIKHQDVADQKDMELIREIDKISEEVEWYKSRENLKKGIMECPHCWAEIPINSKFCTKCGKELVAQNTGNYAPIGKKVCGKCGNLVEDNQKYCRICGNSLAEAESKPDENRCPRCGRVVDESAAFCIYCGISIKK